MKKIHIFFSLGLAACALHIFTQNKDGSSVLLSLFPAGIKQKKLPVQVTTSSWCENGGTWSPQSHQKRQMLYFYERNNPYYEFTNFYAPQGGIEIDDKVWPTTEHYYQAMKFEDPALQEQVRLLATPREAFKFTKTRQNRPKIRSDWGIINLDVMRKAVLAKFSNNPKLKALLLDTGDAVLVEDAGPNDFFYGAGDDCNGENYLGRILMETREKLGGDGY